MATSHKINLAASDRGLSSCFSMAQVKPEWSAPFSKQWGLETLDDFVGIITHYENGNEVWEASVTEAGQAVAELKDKRIVLTRFKNAYSAGRDAILDARLPSAKNTSEDHWRHRQEMPEGHCQELH